MLPLVRFRWLRKARLSRGDRGITIYIICGTAFAGRCFHLLNSNGRGQHLSSHQAEGATESASQRRDLILGIYDATQIGCSHLHSLPESSRIFQTCHAEEGFCAKDILQAFERRHCADCADIFGQLRAADLLWESQSVLKSVLVYLVCFCMCWWDCNQKCSRIRGRIAWKLQAPWRFQLPRRRAEWSSCSSHSPGAGQCWAVLGVGKCRDRAGSSRLEFGEAEARWKVTESLHSRYVIAEGFAALCVHRQQGSNKGTSSNNANTASSKRSKSHVLHLHLWPANRFLVLTFAEIIRFICGNVWVSALNVYRDRCSHTQSRNLESRWMKNSFNISIIPSRAHCLDSRSCSLSASGKSGQTGKEVTETWQSRASIKTQMQLTYNLVRLDATRTSLDMTCPYTIQLVRDRFFEGPWASAVSCESMWILTSSTSWLQECAGGVCLSPNCCVWLRNDLHGCLAASLLSRWVASACGFQWNEAFVRRWVFAWPSLLELGLKFLWKNGKAQEEFEDSAQSFGKWGMHHAFRIWLRCTVDDGIDKPQWCISRAACSMLMPCTAIGRGWQRRAPAHSSGRPCPKNISNHSNPLRIVSTTVGTTRIHQTSPKEYRVKWNGWDHCWPSGHPCDQYMITTYRMG